MEFFSFKGGCDVRECVCIKAFKIMGGLGYRSINGFRVLVIQCYLKQLYH